MHVPDAHYDANGSPLPHSACPRCGYVMECATPMFGDCRPRAGDLTVCIQCAQFCVFDETMGLRALTAEEFGNLPVLERTQLERARHAVQSLPAGLVSDRKRLSRLADSLRALQADAGT